MSYIGVSAAPTPAGVYTKAETETRLNTKLSTEGGELTGGLTVTPPVGESFVKLKSNTVGATSEVMLRGSDNDGFDTAYNSTLDQFRISRYVNDVYQNSPVVVDANGNVGIGTSSTGRPLHVYHATDNGMALFESGDSAVYISFKDNNTSGDLYNRIGATGDDLQFYTNNLERMRIDSAGRVTMPYQPAVSATRNTNFGSNGAGQTLINFEGVQVNVGNHYNSATGIFTCPVNGTYRVTAFGMVVTSTSASTFVYNAATARHNGSQIGAAAYNWGDGYVHISGNWMINASAGDALSVYMSSCLGGYGGLTIELIG